MSGERRGGFLLHQAEVSPFCGKVRRMLVFKGIDFAVENYHGLRALQMARLSPGGFVPVLDAPGRRIHDSSRIAIYLDEHYPDKPLRPQDPARRALTDLWDDWADESFHLDVEVR